MVFFILCVAVFNLALGYGLAVYMHGRGGPLPWSGWQFSLPFNLPWLSRDRDEMEDETDVPHRQPAPAPAPILPQDTSPATLAVEATPPAAKPAIETTPDPTTEPAVAEVAADAPAAATPPGEMEIDQERVAEAVAALRSELTNYREQITTIDTLLRDCAETPDAPTVRSCAEQLREVNDHYLEKHEACREQLAVTAEGPQATGAQVRELTDAVDRQARVIEAAQAELARLDPESDLLVQCQQMLAETGHLSETSQQLHDTVVQTLAEFVGREPPAADAATWSQPAGQAAPVAVPASDLAAMLQRWREENPGTARRLSIAMIDPDQLNQLNEGHSREAVERSLMVLDRIVKEGLESDQRAVRCRDESHLLLLPDLTPREAVNLVERRRQKIDATRFNHDGDKFRLTVSCAVAEALADEDAAGLAERLEVMLSEAKRYGRNRTFFQDGKHPTPAVPPALEIEAQTVSL